MIKLFENKADCCACGACENICPKSAIKMKKDEYGFTYPQIDEQLCIECNQCKNVCAFQHDNEKNIPIEAYAAAVNDKEAIMHSTSGGIFAVLAKEMLERGGVVFGVALEKIDKEFTVHHICVESSNNLHKILKSKYVHSATEDCYKKAKEYLDCKKPVLYSGTPCQIAGLKGYLKKPYKNLITVDIICHGVPSLELFNKHIKSIEKREKITVTDYCFRDKEKACDGYFNKIEYQTSSNEQKSKSFNKKNRNFSYTKAFLADTALRENCYSCKYTNSNRPSDITIGDYWGIKNVHSEWLIGPPPKTTDGLTLMTGFPALL